MWTPKRVLILFAGLLLFLAAFGGYAYFFGGIDGLSQLPDPYKPPKDGVGPDQPPPPPPPPEVDRILAMAFGNDCLELGRTIKLLINSKKMALAADSFEVEPDGRVKLAPLSAALFRNLSEGPFPEFNTVQADVAILTLNEPVDSVTQLASRKIIGVELRGGKSMGINITHNRKTQSRNDDLEIFISNAPLFFDDRKNLIWSEGLVKMTDQQTQPATTVRAQGMEIHTAKDASHSKSTKGPKHEAEPKNPLNGIDLLVLRSHVEMHLYTDARSGFLNGTEEPGKKVPYDPKEKAHLVILTNGPFTYEPAKDLAHFEIPRTPQANLPLSSEQVHVLREHKSPAGVKKTDQLFSDVLDIQFRKKPGADPKSTGDKEIQTVIATSRSGKEVSLILDSENLEAFGTLLRYDGPTESAGPKTMLKGDLMHAVKDGHRIEARELHLQAADKNGLGQQAFAHGPGLIDLFKAQKLDPMKGGLQGSFPFHARWDKTLTLTKVKEDGKSLDLLTLLGNSSFKDDEHAQELRGEKIQVWLESVNSSEEKKALNLGSRQRPHKLEASENVSVFSPEMIVKNTRAFKVRFRDEVPVSDVLPDALPTATIAPVPAVKNDFVPMPSSAGNPPSAPGLDKNGPPKRARPPIEIEANQIYSYVNRLGSKNELHQVDCEGNVVVYQEPNEKGEKGVHIHGEMLNLRHHPNGDILRVYGDARREAKLQYGDMMLFGPKVVINQLENVAEVQGTGGMRMPSNKNLDGTKTAGPPATLTIHWNKAMLFRSRFAEFFGGVVAYQDNSSLKCDRLEVVFDQEVSFKETKGTKQSPRIENLMCHKDVLVREDTRDAQGQLIEYRGGRFHELDIRNDVNDPKQNGQFGNLNGSGPGRLESWTKNSSSGPVLGPQPPPGTQTKPEPKFTRVDFDGRVRSINMENNVRVNIFYDNVKVYHVPSENQNPAINPLQPPKNGFYLTSEQLTVTTRPRDGKNSQEMQARIRVQFQTDEFMGVCDVLTYDESQNHVVFKSESDRRVVITKLRPNVGQHQQIRGKTILYKLKTGEFLLDGIDSIQSGGS